jgi:hypothetical protein
MVNEYYFKIDLKNLFIYYLKIHENIKIIKIINRIFKKKKTY